MQARFIRSLLWLVAQLPLGMSRALGRGLGRVAWWVGGSARGVTLRNIDLAFPELSDAQRRALARCSLIATVELAAEMGYVWFRPWTTVQRKILCVHGAEAVAAALAEGQGVMVLGPHLGNWEVVGLHMATLGEAVALYEPPHMRALDGMIRAARERSGSTLLPTDARGLGTLVRSLRKGGIAAILPDQVPPVVESGENSVFMGVSCFTGTLASKLLSRSGARAFFAFAQRVPGGFHVHYLPADPALYSGDIQQSLLAINRGVEGCLRRCPAQYQWEYKRFRTRPRKEDHYAGI